MGNRSKILLAASVVACLSAAEMAAQDGSFSIEVYKQEKAYNGTTMFADNSREGASRIVEVDMTGRVVWEYPIPETLLGGRGARRILMDVERLPNNNVLFNIQNAGIFEVNRSGRVVWSHLDAGASHDVDRLSNGNTLYVRGWVSKGEPHVVEVDSRGTVVWSWDGIRQFDRPPYSTVDNEGWIHVNAATRLENGNTLINLRNFNAVVEVDRAGDIVEMLELPLQDMPLKRRLEIRAHPHDPELLANGNLLVALTGTNLVVEIDRKMRRPVWKWEHPDGPQNTAHVRDANRLPNGNTLIVEANAISEIAPDAEVVWRLRAGAIDRRGRRHTFLYKAQRIGPEGQAFGG